MDNLEVLKDKILEILKPYGVRRVAQFGSIVRGEATPESDLDILVEFRTPHQRPLGFFELVQLEDRLGRAIGRRVEIISEKALSPLIRPYVDEEKILIYEEV